MVTGSRAHPGVGITTGGLAAHLRRTGGDLNGSKYACRHWRRPECVKKPDTITGRDSTPCVTRQERLPRNGVPSKNLSKPVGVLPEAC